ncbi:MAG: 1-acyl-sn-glycerol-3-phosphate acyltransferase [Chloroflexota bacterium]|nr:1-acyl-sn-glycerol-3-phosphate acyltransferase [Chloroflexota bacterium]
MRLLAASLRAVLSAVSRVRVEGIAELPREGPLIVAANHVSNADAAFIGAWLQPALGRPIQFMAKEELFRTPLLPVMRAYGAILVKAGGSDAGAYRVARAVLRRGGIVGVFPEGSRSASGVLSEALHGAALLATRAESAVLPVAVSGTDRFLPRGAWRPRLGVPVTVRVGEPFRLRLDPSLEPREAVAAATDELMRRIAELLPPDRRGRHTTVRDG